MSGIRVLTNALIARHPPAAIDAIQRIDEKAPDKKLKRVEHAAQEVLRQKTWEPLSATELIDLVTAQRSHGQQRAVGKRNSRYEKIDRALKQIAECLPRTQEEVFKIA
jgi:hypothetical protein